MREGPDRRFFGPGDVIIREGDRGSNFFLIEKGLVEVVKQGPSGQIVLGHIGIGGVFGEMALIDDRPRMATVTAVDPTTCKVFPKSYLDDKIARSDKLVRALMKIFVEHIRSITELQVKETKQPPS
ncbi:MAG: cyclic nucleotide-binding domain-containing protein [Alphaproteobacteria bacterium]|nr:MAG: cyclic nucleotide-binding domain-containing protein [Alphaproteobacteria bacterium]